MVFSFPSSAILLATHNGECWICEQLDSLSGQDRVDLRVIAGDDHSMDGTMCTPRERVSTSHSAEHFLAYMNSPERAAWLASTQQPWQEVLSPGWNNSLRYGDRFTALQPLNPCIFGNLVGDAVGKCDLPPLLNAWNEWIEGAAIEPCAYLVRSYLDAVTAVIDGFQ